MKAKLLNSGQKIFYRKKRKQPRKSLSLDDCLKRVFTSINDPVKLNIERIHNLRNSATHLVIPFIPIDIMGLFQAGVLNYPKLLKEWFDISISDRVPLGMMVLVYDFDPSQHSLEHARMTRKLSPETIKWLTEFQTDIRKQATSLGENAQRFYIPVDLKLAIVKTPGKADLVLGSGTGGKEALILEVPKDPNKTHPYRQTEVVSLVNQKFGGAILFNRFDFQCIKKVYSIENRPEFCYLPKFYSPQYSEKLVDWIVEQMSKKPDFCMRTRSKAKIKTKKKKPS